MMGFRPVARHRSREVLLYRQGDMNIIVNAHAAGAAAQRAAGRHARDRRDRAARARRRRRLPPRAAARRLGRADAGGGDGAEHPGDPRRGRQPHLLRRPLPRLLDLRRRLHADPDGRPEAAGAGRAALVRHRAVHRQRAHGGLDRVLPRAVRLQGAARRTALRHPAQGPHPAEPVDRPARQLLPAADRARARHPGRRGRRIAAAHRPRHARRAGQRGRAAPARRGLRRVGRTCTPKRAAR